MSVSNPTQLDCIDVSQQSNDEILKVVVDELVATKAENQQLREKVTDLEAQVSENTEEIDDNSEQIEANADSIEENADNIADERETRAKESAEDRRRITELENDIEASEAQGSTGEKPTPDNCVTPETPLEQTTALPQDMIDEESPNVRRAVFVASDVTDYSRKVPAGRAIKSSELRKVLKAGTDASGHTQTVSRVMSVLDDMGGDDVKIVDRRGEKRVVFTQESAERLEELSQSNQGNHAVVMGDNVRT